jgi:hypothetical protein
MCDVRKSVVRMVLMGLAAGLLAGAMKTAKAQVSVQVPVKKRRQETHARRETNATRLARIQRNIQETYSHRYEVIGGGGYLRFRSGEYTKKNNEVSWATALNYYFNPKFALVGDARGSFGSAHAILDNTYGVNRPQINEYMFTGGASYRFYRTEKIAVSAQALGGVGWGIFSGGAKGLTGADLGLWQDGIRPAVSFGISGDYNIQPNLAIRITPTYMGTMFRSGPDAFGVTPPSPAVQNNIGVNVGIIYRFGHQ